MDDNYFTKARDNHLPGFTYSFNPGSLDFCFILLLRLIERGYLVNMEKEFCRLDGKIHKIRSRCTGRDDRELLKAILQEHVLILEDERLSREELEALDNRYHKLRMKSL